MMRHMKKLFGILESQSFGIAILACATVSFSFPSAFTSWGGVKLTTLVTPAIQIIMFGMGTTLTPADFVRVVKCPWAVATGVFLQFLIMPIVGFSLAIAFGFSGELAAGCVLIGSVAGGTASNVIAYLAKANVALSVTMTCCSTLLSPFVTPFLMKTLAGRFVSIDAKAMMLSILMIVIVPVAAGGFVRWIFRKPLEAHKASVNRGLSFVSMTGICYTILALTAPSRETFKDAGVLIILAAILHNSFGYASGYWLTRLLGRFLRLDGRDARTVAIEVGMQNGGMAGALATDVLKSAVAALPANVFSIWMNFSGSILANWWSRRNPKTREYQRDGRETPVMEEKCWGWRGVDGRGYGRSKALVYENDDPKWYAFTEVSVPGLKPLMKAEASFKVEKGNRGDTDMCV